MTYTDSDPVQAGLQLQGVWLHDPLDPVGTIVVYLYGRANKTTEIEVAAVGQHYAGRRFPVYDHGDQQEDIYSVSLDVVESATSAAELAALEAFATARRTLVMRDNRGRMAYGVMSGYDASDQDWGVSVSFTFTRTDYQVVV